MRCLRLLLLSWSCRATTFKANYFHSTLTAIPSDLPYQTVSSTATPSTLDFSSSDFASQPSTGFAAQFATTLSITTAGYYSFQMDFRDGARLKFSSINVDDPPVLELDGVISGSDANVRTSAPRYYASGAHQLYVEYFSTGSNARLSLKYKGPDTSSAWELVCGTSSRCGTLDPLRAPQITLFGDIPSYFLKNISTAALYEDLGHQCVGSGSNWDVVLEAPSMAVPGIFTVNYTCQDSYGLIDTATREVQIRDWQSMALIGPNPFKMLRGDAFADPEVCCLDFEGTALTWVKFGTVDPDTAGIYEMSYTCVDPLINTMVTIKREVWVNTPPSMFLLGDASVKITKGTGYEDAGVVCQDSEDGLISPLLPNNEEIIVPARIYTSAALAFATNRAAADGGASTACGNCQEVATGHVRWVMLDLGAARSVTEVRVNTPEAGFRVHVALLPWPIQGTENATLYASTTGTCSSVAKQEIWDLELCQRAAEHLTLSVTSAAAFSSATGSAHACVYDSSDKSLKIQLGDARGTYGAGLSGKSATAEAALSGTQTRICGPLAPYTRIQAGFCEDVGYQPIRTAVRCGMAARSLGLTMNAHSSTASAVAPGGCYLYSSDWSIRLNQAQGSKEYVSSTALSSLCQLPGSCIDFYTSYPDGSMVSGTSSATKDTWGDCMATCASNSGCGVWSYDSSSQACKLFVPGAVGSASTDANLLSGPPFCQEVPGVSCHEEFSASTGWINNTCLAPTVGRYVTVWTRRAAAKMTVCDVEVRGGLAPKPPETFSISLGCSGASISGNFILNTDADGWPMYQYPQESVFEVEMGQETANYTYDAVNQRWVLSVLASSTISEVAYAYTAAALPEQALVMTAETGTSLKCQWPLVRPDPAASCSWRFGFTPKAGKYECRDGTLCDTDCCASNGGLYRCPYNLPIMCETASSGLYTCATDCGSAGGPRTCQATDSMASSCFASGINGKTYSTVLSTLTASSTEDCQQRCRRTGGCAHFSYYPTSTASNCKLHDFTATESTESGTTSGPPTCLASVSIVNNVNANQIGFFRLYYLCTDSLGVQSGFSRVVEVGCEGPNPGGVYGGNTITCEKVQSGPAVMADYLACVKECTGDSVCEAYEFMGFSGGQGNCTTWSGCDGKYGTDLETMRQVGYCQRINHYPKIFVTPSDRTVNVGNAYAEGAVACTDYEDPYPPVPTTVTSFDVNVPGQYMFYYTCKDQIGQETLGNRTVTVKANCSSPSGVANAADPPCQEGLATFAHGGTCTTVCLTGYTQSRTSVTCTTNSDADFASDWDNTFVCGDSPCDAPLNVKNLKEATGSETIYSCSEGSQVVSGASCTPNCKEGDDPKYVPTVASLACSKEVLTPSTYECHSVAYMPQYVQYKERDVDKIVVKWAIGSPSDCVFANWRLEYILITSSSGQSAWSDWLENPNCPISALGGTARTDVLECTANTLEEGSTYKFRVRQECTNTDLNSDWQTSEEIATTILTPPVTIFTLPNADVYGSPGSVMVAFDQAVQPGYADRKVELIKFGENCQPSADGTYNFTKYAPEMKTTSLEGASGMEIAGSRILIVTPFAEYFTGSCTYNVSFEAASILPDTTGTIKELVAFWYNFTYIEVPPSLTYITRNDSATSTTAIGYNILWTKRTQMNCTASPKDASSCQAKATTAALSPTIARRCESRNSTNDMIQELDTPLSFTIDDLYPGVQYFVVCAGWIPGQFWVPTVDIDASQEIHQTVTTDQDTEVGISSFRLTVFAVCEDGSEGQVYQAYLRTSEFDLGYTTQIDHWLGACRVGGTLALEESVNFRWLGEVVTVSANAYVQWDAGPSLVVTYTKPADATESAIVTNHLKFTILSLAWWEENRDTYKQAHQVQLQIVDIGFSYPAPAGFSKAYSIQSGGSSLAPLYQSSGEALPSGYEELVLDVGALLHFNIKVSQSSFDWGDVSLHLKSVTVGFPVPMVKVSENGQEALWALNFTGQGTQLPFILRWKSALFVIPLWITFSPPLMAINSLQASLNTATPVTATFSNVPGFGSEAFALPASSVQLFIQKNGWSYNLCGSTSFDSTWGTGLCSLRPAALTDIVIKLQVHNHQKDTFLFVEGPQAAGLSNVITYANPLPTGMDAAVFGAVRENVLDLGMVIHAKPPLIYITGNTFPAPASLDLKGAAVPGYKVELVSPEGWQSCGAVPLCKTLAWQNESHLECHTNACLDITCLPRQPNVKLYLGDLLGDTELSEKINFPRPRIDSFAPTALEDVGLHRYVSFWGSYLSEPECKPEHAESLQFVSSSSSTQLLMGEFKAPCTIKEQNSTYLQCVIVDPIRNVRNLADSVSTVPPVLLASAQTLSWTLCGHYSPLNGDATAGTFASEIDLSTNALYQRGALTFNINLLTCSDGYRRYSDYSYTCIKCEKGFWITTTQAEWPLRCNPCAVGKYQDNEASQSCKSCPAYTTSPQGASDVTHCTCSPGYFSPYYNMTTGRTVPGTPCTSCHHTDYMQEVETGESCGDGGYMTGDTCTAKEEDLCVNVATTSVDFRICKLYCPGGTAWPTAKRTFWHFRHSPDTSYISGVEAYKPMMRRCSPKMACLPGNTCSKEYKDVACSLCVFGYFSNANTGLCEECGEAQKIGMIIMSVVSVIASFGCLVFFAFFMRFNADIVFKRDLLKAIQMYILTPLKKSSSFGKMKRKSEARRAVTIHKSELGMSHSYSKYRELGLVFRVDDSQVVHVAGLLKDSPLRGKVLPGWKLITLSGRRLKARKEAEVQEMLHRSRFPIRMTFSAPRKSKEQERQEAEGRSAEGVNFDDDRKMIVVLLGVMTSFTKVSGFDFQWPDTFNDLVKIAQMFSFNLNFFAPECSAETPYITKWLGYLVIPYFMIMPLTAAYIMACISTLPGLGPEAFETKKHLLTNAWARCICMVLLALLPFHLDTILIPFACVHKGDGIYVLADVASVQCSTQDETFMTMFGAGSMAMMIFTSGFSGLIYCIWCSFQWQQGTRDRRDIPFYVAMVEVSTFGQRGYTKEVRTRVMENVCAVRAFDVCASKLEEREAKMRALHVLKSREARFGEEKPAEGGAELGQDGLQQRLAITKAKKKFLAKNTWPSKADGNLITYGWIFLVNTLLRNLLSNAAIKMTSNNLVVIGAGLQMIIFALNVTMLVCLSPYKSTFVVKSESILMTVLFMVLWCAVMKELLEQHQDRHLYEDMIQKVNTAITTLAFTLMFTVPLVPLYFAYQVMKKAGQLVTGPDAILNEIYFTAHLKKLKRRKDAETAALNKLADNDNDTDEKREMLASVGMIMPHLEATLKRFEESGYGKHVLPEVQRKYMMRLGKLTMKINQERVLAIEAERSRQDAEKANSAFASLSEQPGASAEDIEEARLAAQAAEVSAMQAENRLTLMRKTRQTEMRMTQRALPAVPDD